MTGFNPRPRVGGDTTCLVSRLQGVSFNPRPRVGGDEFAPDIATPMPSFNPRPRVGGDQYIFNGGKCKGVSTHAPAWGATVPELVCPLDLPVSTHAPAWGATSSTVRAEPTTWFQPTPPRGGRPIPITTTTRLPVSTHAPAWGATCVLQS